MLPTVRLSRLAFRATNLASIQLDSLLQSTSNETSPQKQQQEDEHQNNNKNQVSESILVTILSSSNSNNQINSNNNNNNNKSKTLSELVAEMRQKEMQDRFSSLEESQKRAELGILVGDFSSQQHTNSKLSFSEIQQLSQLANFTNGFISQLYHIGVQDRTLWLQLKSLALRCAPFASSLALVNMLECLARRAVIGPLECKSFQLQLGRDISALPAMEILRFVASCQLAGCPLQQNVKDVIADQGESWIQNSQANCSMWWVIADVVDQLPPNTRKTLVTSLVFAMEQIRTSNYSNNNQNKSEAAEKRLKTLWPQHDKDTTFILWRLRTKGMFCLQTYLNNNNHNNNNSEFSYENENKNNNEAFFNPSYSDALLQSIHVDKLPTARCALFLLKALCLGREDLTEAGKIVAEDVCRLIYNNVIDNRVQSHQVLRTIIHSIAAHEQIRTKIETAPLLGMECSSLYLKHHSHHMVCDIACGILKICAAYEMQQQQQQQVQSSTSALNDQVKQKLQSSLRRLLLVTSSSAEVEELICLADKVNIVDLPTAGFALSILTGSGGNGKGTRATEVRKIQAIYDLLKKTDHNNNNNNNNDDDDYDTTTRASSSSLIHNWSEIRSLSAPKIAFYAASAAKNLFTLSPSNSSIFATSTVVAPISNLVSSHQQQQSSSSSASTANATATTTSPSSLDGSLFGLCSAESEIVSHHKGLRALSASDCAVLIGSTSLLPPEAKSLVLRIESAINSSSSKNAISVVTKKSNPQKNLVGENEQQQQQRIARRKKNNLEAEEELQQQEEEEEEEEKDKTSITLLQNPLLLHLKSTVLFLEAQSSINTTLELNSGADAAIFVSAQRRLARLLQLSHPPPFEFTSSSEWIDWCGRLVSAVALHRLSTFRLPLWLSNVFVCHYCCSTSSTSLLSPFRAIRALHACCYFGIDNKSAIDSLLKSLLVQNGDDDFVLQQSVSPKALFQILRSLPHVASEEVCRDFIFKIATPFVKQQLEESTKKLNEAKQQEQEKKKQMKNEDTENAREEKKKTTQQQQQNVSAFQTSSSFFKGGFSSAANPSSSGANVSYFSVAEKRTLFDLLCCSAHLDIPPLEFKHLIEHLHPFDTTLYPLADSIFFFGHAAQKKRLSGFSLRVWRTLTMQLDKVTLSTSETLSSTSSSSSLVASAATTSSTTTMTSSSNACGTPLVQTSMIVPPILLSIAYYVANGGGSSACDSLVDKLKRLGPFEPLLLAKVVRVALAPAGLKTRPALSQFICNAFDATVADGFSSHDLVKIMEVFHNNQAQRVAVGLIQADAAVTLAWEALYPRLKSLDDDLFLRAASIPCSSSLPAKFVTSILKRLMLIAKKSKKEEAEQQQESIVVRDRLIWTPIIFHIVVSHVANVRNFHNNNNSNNKADVEIDISDEENDNNEMENAAEFWEEIKKYLLEPLAPHLRGADKEAITELMLM